MELSDIPGKYFEVEEPTIKAMLTKCGERPGLFHITLTASQNPPANQLTQRIKVAEKLIRDFPEGFTRQASRNLLGAFYFYDSQFSKAIQTFQEVIENDSKSLTASANLAFVYQRLKINSKVSEYESKLSMYDSVGQGIVLADQAFALLFDCYVEKDILDRNILPKELFCQSLLKLESSNRHQYITEIQYWLGVTYSRLYAQCPKRTGTENMAKECFMKGTQLFADVIKYEGDGRLIKEFVSASWVKLGIFLSKTAEHKGDDIKTHLQKLNLLQYLQNPEKCFKVAVRCGSVDESQDHAEFQPSNEVLNKYAIFLMSRKRHEEALDKLNQSLSIDNSQGNWYSLTLRAKVLSNLGRTDEAICDWERSCSWNGIPTDWCELAKAYHSKYKLCKDSDQDTAQNCILKASDYFLRAVQNLWQEKRPEVHSAYGEFLREIGEVREAIECFKRAIEVETPDKATQSFRLLFETLLQFYKSCRENSEKTEEELNKSLDEMTYLYDVELRKHGDLENETKGFIKDFEEEMLFLTAYFKYYRSQPTLFVDGKSLSDYITSTVEPEKIEKWMTLVEENVKLIHNRDKFKRQIENICSKCGGGYTKRQLSFFPEPRVKPRSLRYPFDFYVIFSPPDRDWVCHVLLQTLEVSYGYKGAVAERDMIPGSKELFERVSFIQNCPKILVILRQEFENYPECNFELAHAVLRMKDKNSERIVVPICRTINGMHPVLKTITYLNAIDDCNWNKLIRAIESK
ncbi:tetratricopeptide repeat protein 22-like isoform X1 [Saccostrea cucullata]|uniref:tetratricopeptide repeat protein 22-like isoform X1 n=1 Tax=Saccostrea cuccullata TaxID=36930 RepID=UPI002ED63C18